MGAFRLIFLLVKKSFALLLALGAIVGVAASIIIMNLLVGYFSVATDAYTSLHPHITLRGSWSAQAAEETIQRIRSAEGQIRDAAPALHFEQTLTIASVDVITELCPPGQTKAACDADRDLTGATRQYAYEVTRQKRVTVQVRGVAVKSNDTIADFRKLMVGEADIARLVRDRDTGGNVLPIGFLAQDTVLGTSTNSYLISTTALQASYDRYYRLGGVLRLGAKSSGLPLLVFGLQQVRHLAPEGLPDVNAIEISALNPLLVDDIAARLRATLEPGITVTTWADLERPAFQFLSAIWTMVFAVMLSICVVVAISIYSTLTLSVMRNEWKVALLGVVGLTPLQVAMVFIYFGAAVATVGIGGGIFLGEYLSLVIGGSLYREVLGLPYDSFAATMSYAPAVWMGVATMIIFLLSVLLPVRAALGIRPAQAMRSQV